LRRFSALSLRARLVAAFTVLIVTSASATILIGDLVFGNKVVELARAEVDSGLNVADLAFAVWQDRMRQRSKIGARLMDLGEPPSWLCRTILEKPGLVDFALALSETEATLILPAASPAGSPLFGSDLTSAPPDLDPSAECRLVHLDRAGFRDHALDELTERAASLGTGASGLVPVSPDDARWLGYQPDFDQGLFLAAASKTSDGRFLVLGALLNGRRDFVSTPLDVLFGAREEQRFVATLFLGSQPIASSAPERLLSDRLDASITRPVLELQERQHAAMDIRGTTYYAAYMPLLGYDSRPIGILGIGAREQVYSDVRNRTLTLFASLIIAGMLFGFAMAYVFSAWLIKPVAALAEGMHKVAEGDLDYKVRFHAADELGRLARAFNIMVRKVKERDIRLREMTEERLTQVEKQVSIGRLAAGVAHEINNPLTSVLTLSHLLLKHADEDDSRREDLEIIVQETTRCRDIVRNLLDFARERPTEKREVDINQVVRETLVLVRRYEGMDKVQTTLALSPEPLLVQADPKQLQQVITNLVTNAAEACPGGGTITISTDEDSSGDYALLAVADTGRGIPKSYLDRIFEPFFTTKGTSRGTGLGLSVSLGIIRRHDGTIDVTSQEGKGTTVTVTLPRSGRHPGQEA
jgi:two-component system NtrC family sensor kinase